MTSLHIFIVAVENSADQLGAGLIKALHDRQPSISLSAIGGTAMEACGITSRISIEGLSILGFSEALRVYPLILKRVKETVKAILNSQADAVVLIDSWGFMIRVAQRLKRAGYKGKIIKYVAPQVWAMREGRAKILAKSVDHLLTIHNFDAPYFQKYGLAVTHIGNPMFDTDFSSGDASRLRKHLNLNDSDEVCAILFGSRQSELFQLRRPITDAVSILQKTYPNLVFVSPVSDTLRSQFIAGGNKSDMANITLLNEDWKFDVFAAASVAIACSGTVTTQLASVGIPSVVIYKLKPLTWWAAKRLYKPDYISLVNISAGQALMPELLQDEVTGGNIAQTVLSFLGNPKALKLRSNALKSQAKIMRGGRGSASESAAIKLIELLEA